MNFTKSIIMGIMSALSCGMVATAETVIEWQLLHNLDEVVNSSLPQTSSGYYVVVVSDSGPYALSQNNVSNGMAAIDIELNEDKSQVINPPEDAIFEVRMDVNRNNLISINLMADNGYLVNNGNLQITLAAPFAGNGWLLSDFSSDSGVFYLEQRPIDKYRFVCLKDGGKRFNTDELIKDQAGMRMYLRHEVTTEPIEPDPVDPDTKPDAPTFSLSDGFEADENGWVDLSSVEEEIVVTLEAPENCTAWYCLAYNGHSDEPEFEIYTGPIHIKYAGELSFYSENDEGVKSDPNTLLFTGYTVTTSITTIKQDVGISTSGYDICGRPVRQGHKGITITPHKKTIK